MEDREHIWPLSAADTAKLAAFLANPNGSWRSADWNVTVDSGGSGRVLVRTQRWRHHAALWARCVYCGNVGETQADNAELEPIAPYKGNFACKAVDACAARQDGADPVHVVGRLLRQLRAELDRLDPAQLASLAVDAEDFGAEVRERLSRTGQSVDLAVYAERCDRAERQGRLF